MWHVTLHFSDRHGAASLCYRKHAEITVLMCEQKPYSVSFLCRRQKLSGIVGTKPKQRLVSSVGRASVCRTEGRGFKPRPDQHSRGLLIFRPNWSPKCCLCNDICKCLDFLVFSDKDEKPWVPSHSTFTDLFLWDVKELTSLFEKSKGRRPRWCGQPLRVVGLGRDGTLHGTWVLFVHIPPRQACVQKSW